MSKYSKHIGNELEPLHQLARNCKYSIVQMLFLVELACLSLRLDIDDPIY